MVDNSLGLYVCLILCCTLQVTVETRTTLICHHEKDTSSQQFLQKDLFHHITNLESPNQLYHFSHRRHRKRKKKKALSPNETVSPNSTSPLEYRVTLGLEDPSSSRKWSRRVHLPNVRVLIELSSLLQYFSDFPLCQTTEFIILHFPSLIHLLPKYTLLFYEYGLIKYPLYLNNFLIFV